MALAFAPYGKTLTVRRIDLDDKTRRHLNNLGLVVGAEVTPIHISGGDVILRVRDSKLAVNRALAMRITVA